MPVWCSRSLLAAWLRSTGLRPLSRTPRKCRFPKPPPAGVQATQRQLPDSPVAADAKVLLRTKQFDAAVHELRAAAERGDVESEYLLGLVYANGLGTPVSDSDARRWLTAAADKSYSDASRALAGLTIPPTRGALGDVELARELLIWAIRHRDEQSIETFVRATGAQSDDDFGRAPLSYAVMGGSDSAVRLLLAADASADHADHFGITPLMLAAEAESPAVLESIVGATKNLDARDSVGNTALFYAARVGRSHNVQRLLTAGASFARANADGWTVLDVSMKTGHSEVHGYCAARGLRVD